MTEDDPSLRFLRRLAAGGQAWPAKQVKRAARDLEELPHLLRGAPTRPPTRFEWWIRRTLKRETEEARQSIRVLKRRAKPPAS